jgi:MYXO-CTERM domain-containing protein
MGLWVDIPAALPGVTGVGGTEFPKAVLTNTAYWASSDAVTYPASGGVSLEAVWNDSQSGHGLGGGGGGKSQVFTKPSYQQGVTPADGARDVPDVVLTASSSYAPYLIYDSTDFNGLAGLGGTSCAAPSFAGILTLANHAVTAKGGPLGLGNANPMLYALSQGAPTAFHDIVVGSNIVPCSVGSTDCSTTAPYQMGYSAAPGYDLASGLGSVDANALVTSWAALTPTTTTLAAGATSATVGTPVTLTATVASTGGTASMTGDVVTFTFETYSPPGAGNFDGGFDDSWILGTVPVTAPTAGSATATLSVAIPPGYDGNADVVAMFEGDKSYMASRSAKTRITVGGLTLAATPLTATTLPSATVQFTASGGTPPYRFYIESDSSALINKAAGTEVGATVDDTGLLTAGPLDGVIALEVLDAAGVTVWMNVVVAGNAPEAGTADDGGSTVDASAPTDASVTPDGGTTHDGGAGEGGISIGDAGGATDAGGAKDSGADAGDVGSGKSGCSCTVVASDAAEGKMGALGALLAAAAFVRRRRRA